MDKAMFSHQILGLVNSITGPLLHSIILIDNLINEEVNNIEDYGRLRLIDEQVQSSIEYFLELRTLVLNKIESDLINRKIMGKRKRKSRAKKSFVYNH